MPERVVVVFSAQWAFLIFERNIYDNKHSLRYSVLHIHEKYTYFACIL